MPEKEFATYRKNSIDAPTGFELALTVAGDIAASRGLGQEASEALSKFATITYRINKLRDDIGQASGITQVDQKTYEIGINEDNILMRKTIKVKDYADFMRIHTQMAFNLYDAYLA